MLPEELTTAPTHPVASDDPTSALSSEAAPAEPAPDRSLASTSASPQAPQAAPQDPDLTPDAPPAPETQDPDLVPDLSPQAKDPDLVPEETAPAPPKEPDMAPMKNYVTANFKDLAEQQKAKAENSTTASTTPTGGAPQPPQTPAQSVTDAIEAGWQMSVQGLIKRGSMPDKVLPEDAGWAMRIAFASSQFVSDLPIMGLAAETGIAGGASVGALAGPAGAVVGAALGGAATGWAAPIAMRSALIRHYKEGNIKDAADFLQRTAGVTLDAMKGAGVGIAAELTGGIAGGYAKFLGAAPTSIAVSNAVGQLAAMTTVTKAMEGQMPKAKDFSDGAIMMLAFHAMGAGKTGLAGEAAPEGGAGGPKPISEQPGYQPVYDQKTEGLPGSPAHDLVVDKLHDIYVKTGIRPELVVQDANENAALKQDLFSTNTKFPEKYLPMIEKPQPNQHHIDVAPEQKMIEMGSNAELDHVNAVLSPEFTQERGFKVPVPEEVVTPSNEGGTGEPPGGEFPPLTSHEDILQERMAEYKDRPKGKLTFDQVITNTVDNTHPVKMLQTALNGDRPPLLEHENPQIQLRRSRGAYDMADSFIENGPHDYHTYKPLKEGKALKQIFKPFSKDVSGFDRYMLAHITEEYAAKSVEQKKPLQTGVSLESAKAVKKEGMAKYEKSAQEAYDFRNAVLKYQADSGFYSQDEYKAMVEETRRAPAYREKGDGIGGVGSSRAKEVVGSTEKIMRPSASIVKETMARIAAAEQNRVVRLLSDLYHQNWEDLPEGAEPEKGFATRKQGNITQINRSPEMTLVDTQYKPTKLSKAEIQQLLEPHGIDATDNDQLTVFRPNLRPLAKNEIEHWIDGNREIFKVSPEVADVIKRVDPGSANIVSKILSGPAKALSVGATHNPAFLLKHWVRQEVSAMVLSKGMYVPGYNAAKGIVNLLANTEAAQKAKIAGALNANIVTIDKEYFGSVGVNVDNGESKSVFNISKKTGLLDAQHNSTATGKELTIIGAQLKAAAMAIPKAFTAAANLVFNSTKLAEFMNQTKGDYSPESMARGAIRAREVAYDSTKIGMQMRALKQMQAFWHPRMQGNTNLAEAFADRPMATAIRGAVLTAIGALLWLAHKDDKRFDGISRSAKDLNWHIALDNWQPLPKMRSLSPYDETRIGANGQIEINMGTIHPIAKPFEMGVLFSSLPERILDATVKHNPNAFKGFASTVLEGSMPGTVLTAFAPWIEKASNKSLLTGGDIIPHHLLKALPGEQYTTYTSQTAKALGKFVAGLWPEGEGLNTPGSWASPIIIDNTVRDWSGELGRYATAFADQLLIKSGAVPKPTEGAAKSLADNLFFHALQRKYPSMGDQRIQDFYDNFNKIDIIANDINIRKQQNGAVQLSPEDKQALALHGTMVDSVKAVSNLISFIKAVDGNRDLSPDDKRQKEDGLIMKVVGIAASRNDLVEKVKARMK